MKSSKFSLQTLCRLIAILTVLTINILAQTPTGSLVGTITDPTGAAIPDATVTIRDAATGTSRTTVTSQGGAYEFTNLRPATYEVTAEAKGFSKALGVPPA